MKKLISTFTKAFVGLGMLLSVATTANATLISQDILDLDTGDILGSVTVKMDNSRYNTGPVDNFWSGGLSLVEFELGGLYPWGDDLELFLDEVEVDSNNLFAGIQYLSFDGDDVGFGADTWAYQMNYEAGFGGFLDVFEIATGTLVQFENITLGAASVVSAPGTMGLMMLAMGAVYLRRRRQA